MGKDVEMSKRVLLDTNFLLVPLQFGVDIYDQLKGQSLFTLSSCINELEGKRLGKAAFNLLQQYNLKIVKTLGKGDSAIINHAKKYKCKVATNDRELIKTLKRYRIRIIRLRQKKYLEEE